jgi:hypothetical protein
LLDVSVKDTRVRVDCAAGHNKMPVRIHIKAGTPLSKLYDTYRDTQHRWADDALSIFFEKDLIDAKQTALDLELADGDQLTVAVGARDERASQFDPAESRDTTNMATALMAACHDNNARRVRKLLKAGHDPNEDWQDGGEYMSPLSVACEHWRPDVEVVEIVRALLDGGAKRLVL